MKAGFAKVDITPSIGVNLNGYYKERYSVGIISNLYASAVAYSDGENTILTISLDISEILQKDTDEIRRLVSERTGLPFEAIFIACTHTHLGPVISEIVSFFKRDPHYIDVFYHKICDCAQLAIADMKEATAHIAKGECRGISFVRRFRLPDGGAKTNPGVGTPILGPIGEPDETVQLVKLKREGYSDIAIVNFQTHPDVVGGRSICADWPGFMRDTLEAALCNEADGKGVHVIFFNGAEGDTSHADRLDKETMTAKKPRGGLEHSRHMGRTLAGAVLGIYTYTEPVDSSKVFFKQVFAKVAVSKGTDEQVAWAKDTNKRFVEGEEMPFISIVEARRYLRLEKVTPLVDLNVVCVGFGDVAFVGFPGEPFTEIGRQVKEQSPFAMTIPCCNANGSEGYFPTTDALTDNSYESTSSLFKPGVAECLIDTAVKLTKDIKNQNV